MWILFIVLLPIIIIVIINTRNQGSTQNTYGDYHPYPDQVHAVSKHISVPIRSSSSADCTIETRTPDGKTVFRTTGKHPYDVFDRHLDKIWTRAAESEKPATIEKYLHAIEDAIAEANRMGIDYDKQMSEHYLDNVRKYLQQAQAQEEADAAEAKYEAAYNKWFRKFESLYGSNLFGLRSSWVYYDAIDLQLKRRRYIKMFDDAFPIASENNQVDDFYYEINELLNTSNSDERVTDRDSFQRALDRFISEMEPVEAKRNRVQEGMLSQISSGSMQRSILLKAGFADSSEQETQIDYNYLLQKKKLTEEKRNNRYYVSLPQKNEKNSASRSIKTPTEQVSDTDLHDDVQASDELNQANAILWPWEPPYDEGSLAKMFDDDMIPDELDEKNRTAVFYRERENRECSYGMCTCWDFRSTKHMKSPCKHMLRLAYETHAIVLDARATSGNSVETTSTSAEAASTAAETVSASVETASAPAEAVFASAETVSAKKQQKSKQSNTSPKAIRKIIMDYVERNAPVKRIQLYRDCSVSINQTLIKKEYDWLKAHKRLVEKKHGQYMVYLPDQLAEDANQQNTNSSEMDFNEFLFMLQANDIKFVDKTANNGYFWIEATEQTENLSVLSVDGVHPKKATKTRHFDGQPGWYLKRK